MNIENLKEGMTLKSYRDLCTVMDWKIADGEAKMGTYGTEIDIMDLANEEFIVAKKAFRMIFDYLKDNFQMTWS